MTERIVAMPHPYILYIFTNHSLILNVLTKTTGAWIASADAGGKVRVWAWSHPDKLTKLETQVHTHTHTGRLYVL